MPVRDCMTSSPFCPANQSSKFAVPGYESKGCDSCVEERLSKDEIPPCFFNKMEEAYPLEVEDYSVDTFVKKAAALRNKLRI